MGTVADSGKEIVVDKVVYGQAYISQHTLSLRSAHNRHSSHDRQPRHEVISTTAHELLCECLRPVLAATLP